MLKTSKNLKLRRRRRKGGLFAHDQGQVILQGSGDVLTGASPFEQLTIQSSGTYTLNDDVTVGAVNNSPLEIISGTLTQTSLLDALQITGNVDIKGGTYSGIAKALLVHGNINLSSGTLLAPSTTLLAHTLTHTGGTFNANGGTVILSADTPQTIDTSAGTSFNHLTLNDGLVGYWKLDEESGSVEDSSGNNFHGNRVGTLTSAEPFPNSRFSNPRSLVFNNSAVDISHNSLLRLTKGGTLSAWIKSNSYGGDGG